MLALVGTEEITTRRRRCGSRFRRVQASDARCEDRASLPDAEELGALLRRKFDRRQCGEASDNIERELDKMELSPARRFNARFTALKLREAPAPTYRLLREDRVQSVCARQSPLSPLSLGRIGEQDSSGGGRCRRSSCEAWSAASFFPTSRYANREGR